MDFTKFTFEENYKDNIKLFLDFDIRKETGHNRNTFRFYKTLVYFLKQNPQKLIYITKNQTEDFCEEQDKLVINLDKYQEFCESLGRNGENRAQAFFARKLRHYSDDEKQQIIESASEEQLIEAIKNFSSSQQKAFIEKLRAVEGLDSLNQTLDEITDEEFIANFASLLSSPRKKALIISSYSSIQISILEDYVEFLKKNLDKNETFIQNWIDGKINNDGEYLNLDLDEEKQLVKSRCLIFGLEFIDHKREGSLSSKRFDVLARLSEDESEYVLMELKSPDAEVFETKEKENANGGKSIEYRLSNELSRAIPQILRYRDNLESKPAEDEDWTRIGLKKQRIAKCIILIGVRKEEDPIWESHFASLRKSFSASLEIMTYSDLINKLETTIKNLKNNL